MGANAENVRRDINNAKFKGYTEAGRKDRYNAGTGLDGVYNYRCAS